MLPFRYFIFNLPQLVWMLMWDTIEKPKQLTVLRCGLLKINLNYIYIFVVVVIIIVVIFFQLTPSCCKMDFTKHNGNTEFWLTWLKKVLCSVKKKNNKSPHRHCEIILLACENTRLYVLHCPMTVFTVEPLSGSVKQDFGMVLRQPEKSCHDCIDAKEKI